jgi:hypothetical protein
MSTGLVERATNRTPMNDHAGRSGALLERALLDDGRPVVIKTASPALDLAMVVTDDADGRERRLWHDGVLDRLPPGVEHCILDAHLDHRGQVVTVMSDLGDHVVDWGDRLTAADSERIIDAAARLHRAFAPSPPSTLVPLERWLTMLSPAVMARHADGPNAIARSVVHGWQCLRDLVPGAIHRKVAAVHADPGPFAHRLRSHGVTLIHGDLWPVNLALRPSGVVLLDWGLATAAPGVIDLATFVAAAHDNTDLPPQALVDQYVEATGAGPAAVADGFLATLCAFGWNTALSAVRDDDPAADARRQLDWWIASAR